MWNCDANEAIELRNGSAVYAKQKKENRTSLSHSYSYLFSSDFWLKHLLHVEERDSINEL